MTEKDLASDHDLVLKARMEAQAKTRILVRYGDGIGELTTGAHVTFNIREEIEMFEKFGFCRIKEVYVKKQKKGEGVIERYLPNGEYDVHPDFRSPVNKSGLFKGTYICGQELLVFRNFQPRLITENNEMYPETNIPDEFIRKETETLLKEEL